MKEFLLHNWPWLVIAAVATYLGSEYWRYRRQQSHTQKTTQDVPSLLPDELVLMRMVNRLTARQVRIMNGSAVFFVLGILGALYMGLAGKHPDKGGMDLLVLTLTKLTEQPKLLLNIVMLAGVLIGIPRISMAIAEHERLILNRTGIRYQSPFRGLLSALNPGWQLSWSEIESVSLSSHLVRGRLIIKPYRGKRRVLIAHIWRRPEEFAALAQLPLFSRLREIRRQQTEPKAILELPLLRYLREVGAIAIDTPLHEELAFDLARNPVTRLLLVVLFGLIGYGLVDFIANTETYVATPPVLWFVLAGVLLTLGLGIWQRQHSVPTVNAWGLAVLFGVIFALAMYPALLRINQWTDSVGLQRVEYRHVTATRFHPVHENLPEITLPADAYWQSLPENELVAFSLRHGKLGFYQIDMAPEYAKMRQWYCRRRAKQDPVKLRYCDKL